MMTDEKNDTFLATFQAGWFIRRFAVSVEFNENQLNRRTHKTPRTYATHLHYKPNELGICRSASVELKTENCQFKAVAPYGEHEQRIHIYANTFIEHSLRAYGFASHRPRMHTHTYYIKAV